MTNISMHGYADLCVGPLPCASGQALSRIQINHKDM
jgi:hypothetical protein